MRSLLAITLIIMSINLSVQNEEASDHVVVLTDETYSDFIKSNQFVLVKFYAPWCGHCKKMAPDYAKAAEELKDTPIRLAKLDGTENKIANEAAGIEGFPTLKFYVNGEEKEYTGGRTKDDIMTWVQTKLEKHNENEKQKEDGGHDKDEDVFILTDDNIDDFTKENEYVLTMLYAPWCGHCKKMAPALVEAAATLRESHPNIKISKIDATVHTKTAIKAQVRGYPTIKFFWRGNMVEYTGERKAGDIVEWLTQKSGEPSVEVTTVDEIEALKEANNLLVVLFGGYELDTFKTFAVSYDHSAFAHTFNEDLFKHYKVKKGSVVLFKNFDERRNELPGVYNIQTMKTFVDSRSVPSLIEYSKKSNRFIYDNEQPIVMLFYDKTSSDADTLDDVMVDLARRVKGRILVGRSEIKSSDEKNWSEGLGVREEMLPIVMIVDPRDTKDFGKRYIMSGYKKINSNTIRKFIGQWMKGDVEKYVKSEEIPEYENGPVKVLVGKSFDSVVDGSKDVLVEFYAPWCGHCQKLAPIYEDLARSLSHNDGLIIAKIDATANEVPNHPTKGYPTIKFFPAGKHESPIEYKRSSSDTIDVFTDFIKQHATLPVSTGLDFDDVDDEEEDKTDL